MINVLIVEDDPMVAEMNKFYLSQVEGFQFGGWAASASEALDLLEQQSFELVLLDIYMKEQNGLELLSEIRRANLSMDVIIISAASDKESIRYALQNGAVDYLIKPFEFERFRSALAAYRERYSLLYSNSSLAQAELDMLTQPSSQPDRAVLSKGFTRTTLRLVWEAIQAHQGPSFSSEEIAGVTGLSRVSVGKYLIALEELKVLELETTYGTIGRPVKKYHIVPGSEAIVGRYI
ncbi:response regulator [Paenibacillus kandeliae]|uniref:response regulator n=1 Tax=Paenibacillus kandeliae TaxID=3231269 RepID=UPI003458633B